MNNVVHLVWINIIIDVLAVPSLLAECPDPTDPLIQRHPLNTCHPLVSQTLVKNIFGQVIFQLSILFYLLFQGDLLLNIEPGIHVKDPSQHSTMVFNTLIMMILFSIINARKIYGERNVFSNILNNTVLFTVWHMCFVSQVLIVHFGKAVCHTEALDFDQWLWSLFFGIGVLVWAQIIRTLPTSCVIPHTLFTYSADTPLTDKEWNSFQTNIWIRGPERTKTEIDVLSERHGKVYPDLRQKM
ncbi:plasma membrane calcium-transporting ATPase 1-like [Schistocerca gregaria]|uniref:plasma membrane calcium-transporting ATPase 1-like n=1 Tax=Schistocerca gregaria TaxID=7010 RepID=UPI00211EA7EC|nr:plasma membrane calcium-transporting ATPase 1-like [Schistocerca gregaria]